ncbi:MAG: hypothetical protein ABIG71_01295 [Candidatus Uhrbacteria bacterium]
MQRTPYVLLSLAFIVLLGPGCIEIRMNEPKSPNAQEQGALDEGAITDDASTGWSSTDAEVTWPQDFNSLSLGTDVNISWKINRNTLKSQPMRIALVDERERVVQLIGSVESAGVQHFPWTVSLARDYQPGQYKIKLFTDTGFLTYSEIFTIAPERSADIGKITHVTPEEGILDEFAAKYHKSKDEILIIISQQSEHHARGSVEFLPGGPGNGGNFLAAQEIDGDWHLVFDGNGDVKCADLEPYNFPEYMIASICH